jgi:predicted RNA methylase
VTEPTLAEVLARSGDTPGLIIDLFAGGGGASTGLEAALGRSIDVAVNHDRVALDVHRANHPDTFHSEANIWEAQPQVPPEMSYALARSNVAAPALPAEEREREEVA